MTDQEIKTIQEKLGPEFEIKRLNGSVVVDKKDVWEGVEFVINTVENEIHKISKICGDKIWLMKGTWLGKSVSKPSTEQAYKGQLIKEAKERFGDIKNGDVFECSNIGYGTDPMIFKQVTYPLFDYLKDSDELYLGGFVLYKKGKWAEKVDNPIVKAEGGNIDSGHFYFIMNDPAKQKCRDIGCWEVNVFLAQSLQEYLSKKERS